VPWSAARVRWRLFVPPLVRRLAPEDACASDMLVLIRWQGRDLAVPLSQLAAVDADESTAEAIGDWHYLGGARLPFLKQTSWV